MIPRSTRTLLLLALLAPGELSSAFVQQQPVRWASKTVLDAKKDSSTDINANSSRRTVFRNLATAVVVGLASGTPSESLAASFTAGGTLVDREVGAQVGNAQASASRKQDNSNVIFDKDHYYKFGVAAPWIEPGSTEFPKSVPFTPSQQRYDALKKYGARVKSGIRYIQDLEGPIKSASSDFVAVVPDPAVTQEYMLRPMGLLANSFLASENTGATNELFLARWYINEIYLQLVDARAASSKDDALKSYGVAKKALNSYLGLMNRVINAKVGDKFDLVAV